MGGPLLIVPRVGAGAGIKLPGIGKEGLELGEQGIQHGSPSNVVKSAHSIDGENSGTRVSFSCGAEPAVDGLGPNSCAQTKLVR